MSDPANEVPEETPEERERRVRIIGILAGLIAVWLAVLSVGFVIWRAREHRKALPVQIEHGTSDSSPADGAVEPASP